MRLTRLYREEDKLAHKAKVATLAEKLMKEEGHHVSVATSKAKDLLHHERPETIGIKVINAPKIKNFSENLLALGQVEKWLTVTGGKLIFHGDDGDVTYIIKTPPGHYCCYCNNPFPGQHEARAHVIESHAAELEADMKTGHFKDPNNPAGYRRDHHYHCEKEEG